MTAESQRQQRNCYQKIHLIRGLSGVLNNRYVLLNFLLKSHELFKRAGRLCIFFLRNWNWWRNSSNAYEVMTLSYWWMHWFWITLKICSALSEDISFMTHSIFPNQNLLNASTDNHRTAKAIGITNVNPPINVNPSNSSLLNITKYHKPSSSKKIDFINSNMTTKLNTTTELYFPNKEVTVITQNSTEISLNVTDNQMLINASLNAINHTDSFSYVNETNYNQSLLINTDKMTEKDDDIPGNLSAAGITGITLGCVVIVGAICGISFFLYRSRGFNRPQVLNDRCSNPDSSGYIDDASVRDNSEEMYSLDNDSFLNSLEAMTIQNYWTDTVKHTKL